MVLLLFRVVAWLVLPYNYLIAMLCVLIFYLQLFLLFALVALIIVLSKEIFSNLEIVTNLLQFELAWGYLIVNVVSFGLQLHFLSFIYLFFAFESLDFSIDVIGIHNRVTNVFILHFKLLYFVFAFFNFSLRFENLLFNFIFWYCWHAR